MKIHKRLAALLLALTLCFGFTATAYAHEVPDMNRTGSISAKMLYDGQPVGGGSLVLYRVGDILESDGNYSFTLTDSFKGSGASLTNISDPALAKSLADYAKTNNPSGTPVVIGADGTVLVQSLNLGLYLLVQDKAADGFEVISPFLVSVPMYENGAYIYEVNAEPKLSALTKTPATDPGTSGGGGSSGVGSSSGSSSGMGTLPKTGQLNWPVPVLSALGLCLFFLGWMLRFGSQRKKAYEA